MQLPNISQLITEGMGFYRVLSHAGGTLLNVRSHTGFQLTIDYANSGYRSQSNAWRVVRPTTRVRGYPFPEELRSLTDFADTSWGNDVVDSIVFSLKGVAYLVWIDAESPKSRTREWGYDPEVEPSELNPCPARYALCSLEINGTMEDTLGERQVSDEILETDDESALMESVRKL